MDTRVTGAVTVNPVEPEMVPDVALMVALPAATPVANPALLMVATAVLEELQVTELVRFWVVPLLLVPVAVSWSEAPTAT